MYIYAFNGLSKKYDLITWCPEFHTSNITRFNHYYFLWGEGIT